MQLSRTTLFSLFFALHFVFSFAFAQGANLQPKYGSAAKDEMQKAADAKFLALIDEHYKGNRKKAAEDVAARGWQFLRQGNAPDAMRRFNQAWLIDSANGTALWGMAVIQGGTGKIEESLKLFEEAEKLIGDDIDFAADYAKSLGIAGAQTTNEELLKNAFTRFAQIHVKAPQHTMNLQNWSITLFYVGNYQEAWRVYKLAEATPRRAELDPNFLNALQSKMPRP